jgi:effector-binding domain-containing protein
VGFTTAVPVTEAAGVEEASGGEVVASSLPGGDVARLSHLGSYDRLSESWGRLGTWIGEQGRRPGPRFWEVYVTEPTPEADPASMRTDLYWLLDGDG